VLFGTKCNLVRITYLYRVILKSINCILLVIKSFKTVQESQHSFSAIRTFNHMHLLPVYDSQ